MYFHKIRHPANFVFADRASRDDTLFAGRERAAMSIAALGGDAYRLTLKRAGDGPAASQAELAAALSGPSVHSLAFERDGTLMLREMRTGRAVLEGAKQASFGSCGAAWMLQFRHAPEMMFYGLGEHSHGLEKSGQRVKFWNTDVFGDFSHADVRDSCVNPMYIALPWLIVRQRDTYVGVLVNHPGAVFMDLASNFVWSERNAEDRERRSFFVGAPTGPADIYILVGPSLPALVRKYQTLVGRVPLPPLWALGHHQCRWGYGGPRDLARLDAGFRRHRIPCDGLWLDIDYMERYKVFTFERRHWKDRAGIGQVISDLAQRGRKVVPILDPGVKVEAGYEVCADGLRRQIFCLNPAGQPFVGFVWPGKTYFPDFSLPEARAWWAKRVRALAETGFAGAWIDMNDPAVGAVELDDMLFARGTQPHAAYHNQYALGMAQGTRAGFLAARPDERPFLLSRSAFISSSRYAAVWTGDNVANWHHLRMSIPLSLGLALSGLPFNGPDVCGFMYDTSPRLAIAWYKACFLFPFLRNHSSAGTRLQEPWELGAPALRVIGHFIRLRYKLLPYLYQLFVTQEETGEAILRPLFYDFADAPSLALGRIADQFLVGPAIMQAPVVEENEVVRRVILPGRTHWFSAQDGRWLAGNRRIAIRAPAAETPLFIREGALVPMQAGERHDNRSDLTEIELHCFVRRDSRVSSELRYVCDDGATFAYQRGERTAVTFRVWSRADGSLEVTIAERAIGFRSLRARFFVYDAFASVCVKDADSSQVLALARAPWRFTGRRIAARATAWMEIGER